MIVARRIPQVALPFLLGLSFAIAACATTGPSSPRERFLATLDSLGYDTARTDAPRVAITSQTEPLQSRRIIPRIHVAEDAYVAVINVWPSGVASVIYPESPAEDGFLAGGRTYVMSSVFSGFATMFPPAGAQGLRYARFGRSSDAPVGARGPGYLVVVASRTPLDLSALDTAGLFDEVELGNAVNEMEPSVIAPWIALLASGGNPAMMIDYARYGGYDAMRIAGTGFASGYDSRYCDLDFARSLTYSWDVGYGAGACGSFLRRHYDPRELRPYRPPLRPRPPVVPPDSTAGADTSRKLDTLAVPTSRAAEVRAAWSALVARNGISTQALVPVTEEEDLAGTRRARLRQALGETADDVPRRRNEVRGTSSGRMTGEPDRGTRSDPLPRTRRPAADTPREAAPRRSEPPPNRVERAPRPVERRGDPAHVPGPRVGKPEP